jgi:hypothetical protein
MHRALFKENSYRAITRSNLHRQGVRERLSVDQQEIIRVVSRILPFRTNRYVTSQLIDWSRVPEDPIYRLTFPQKGMLKHEDYETLKELVGNPEILVGR